MNNNETLSPIFSIVNPTRLQADRLADGVFKSRVTTNGHINLSDYEAHHDAGLITIHLVTPLNEWGMGEIVYSVN